MSTAKPINEPIPEPEIRDAGDPIPAYMCKFTPPSQVVWNVKWEQKVLHDIEIPDCIKLAATLALDDMPNHRVFKVTLACAPDRYQLHGRMKYNGLGKDGKFDIFLYMQSFYTWERACETLLHEFGHFYHFFYIPESVDRRKAGTRNSDVTNWQDTQWTNARAERFAETYARYGMQALHMRHAFNYGVWNHNSNQIVAQRSPSRDELVRWMNQVRDAMNAHLERKSAPTARQKRAAYELANIWRKWR